MIEKGIDQAVYLQFPAYNFLGNISREGSSGEEFTEYNGVFLLIIIPQWTIFCSSFHILPNKRMT